MSNVKWIVVLALTGLLCGPAAGAQDNQPQARSAEQLEADYAKSVDALLGRLERITNAPPRESLMNMAIAAGRPGAEAERAALSKVLAERLGPDVPVETRVWLMEQLQLIGRAEAVPGLAKALADSEARIRECARRALAANPSDEAAAALRAAAETAAEPAWQTALAQAMGYQQNPANAAVLAKLAGGENDDVRAAAVEALARVGDKDAEPIIAAAMGKGSPAARRAAVEAYLLLAGRLAETGDKATALKIYRALLGHDDRQVKCAAIIGLGLAGGAAEMEAVVAAMDDENPQVRGAGIEALNLMRGEGVTEALAGKVLTADASLRPALAAALAMRADKSTLGVFVTLAKESDGPTKTLAIETLGSLGDASVAPLLIQTAATDSANAAAARASLGMLQGEAVDEALLAAIGNEDAKIRIEVIRSLADRGARNASPALLSAAKGADAAVRTEALKALALVGDAKALPAVVELLTQATGNEDREMAAAAAIEIALRMEDADVRTAPLLAALPAADKPAKPAILAALGRLGGDKAYQAVKASLAGDDEDVYDAALRALCNWPDAQPADDLLALSADARTTTQKILAQRGAIRMAGLAGDDDAKLAMYVKALQLVQRPDELKLVLGGMGELKSIEALKAVEPYLDNAEVAEEACAAIVRIARTLPDAARAEIRPVLDKVAATTRNGGLRRQVSEVLRGAPQANGGDEDDE